MKFKNHLIVLLLNLSIVSAYSQDARSSIVNSDVVFDDNNGIVVVEAEYFYKQTKNEKRFWYINSPKHQPQVIPDFDNATVMDAGGLAYMEVLPDLFHHGDDPWIIGDNLGGAGDVAVLHYNVFFNNPGKYYVWARVRSNDGEDNTLGAGIDGEYPNSSQILQSRKDQKKWVWTGDNRFSKKPWKIGRAFINVPTTGLHDIQFYMREDGEEFDRFILTSDSTFQITGDLIGPDVTLKEGQLPEFDKHEPQISNTKRQLTNPDGSIYGANVVYQTTNGDLAIEAENFYRQTKTDIRMWHLVTSTYESGIGPDNDPVHINQMVSGGAYLEALPDGRQKNADEMNDLTSIAKGGTSGILSYMVNFESAGKYYVWLRTLGTDGDDNSFNVGIDDVWPDSGFRLTAQCGGIWRWSNNQRKTNAQIAIEIPDKGIHEVQVAMREDGSELDRIFITKTENFIPNDSLELPSAIMKGSVESWLNEREVRMDAKRHFTATNGLVVIEAESAPTRDGWKYVVDSTGHSGLGYIEWGIEGQGIKPGRGVLQYKFEISEPGSYQVFLRGKMPDATKRLDTDDPDGNDIWLKFNGGENIAGQAELTNGFNKIAILGHPAGWTWNTNVDVSKDHRLTPVCRYFDKGVYTLELSGRSEGYALDRIALLRYEKQPGTEFEGEISDRLNDKSEQTKLDR